MTTGYAWERLYVAAAAEANDAELPIRIEEARAAMDSRIRELPLNEKSREERRAIADGLYALRLLWIERCQATGSSSQ